MALSEKEVVWPGPLTRFIGLGKHHERLSTKGGRHPDIRRQIGSKAKEFVRENFLITRHLREYLTLIYGLLHGERERIELNAA